MGQPVQLGPGRNKSHEHLTYSEKKIFFVVCRSIRYTEHIVSVMFECPLIWKDDNVRYTMVPLNIWFINYELDNFFQL